MKTLARLLVSILFISSPSYADKINVFEFTEVELLELEVRKVRGADNKTNYSVGSNENGNYLMAVADNAASGLGKEVKIDLNKTPFINITWKVEKDLPGILENTKKGHDFAARVFVIKKQVQHHYLTGQSITFFQVTILLDLTHLVHIQKNQSTMF